MTIQWYPGHMHKAGRELQQILPQIDVLIEVLDARIPFSSKNPILTKIRGNKPCIKILNKSDLADSSITKQWQNFLEREENIRTIALAANNPSRIPYILELCHKILLKRSQNIGNIQVLIVGIPNVGKSTLINQLSGRLIAHTGNEPAVTKSQQRIKLDCGIVLVDTPGMLWPNLKNKYTGYRLAMTGAIKEVAFDNYNIAYYAIAYLKRHYPELIVKRYKLANLVGNELEILERMGTKRGCLGVGGQVNIERISRILLTEFRSMMLGAITLETPEMIKQELSNLDNN